MNLLMTKDKALRFTNALPLYQYDSLLNPLRTLVPIVVDDADLTDYSVKLEYILPDETVVEKDLIRAEENYNDDYFAFFVDLNDDVTALPGNVVFRLKFTNGTGTKQFITQATHLSVQS